MIDDLSMSGKWTIKLKTRINLMVSKNSGEKCLMYCKSNNKEIMIWFDIDKIIKKLFDSFLQSYKEGLENSMK